MNSFEIDKGYADLEFSKGTLWFGAGKEGYDCYEGCELTKEETRELYEDMKKYYDD